MQIVVALAQTVKYHKTLEISYHTPNTKVLSVCRNQNKVQERQFF